MIQRQMSSSNVFIKSSSKLENSDAQKLLIMIPGIPGLQKKSEPSI